jgi:serine/threonine-protein kinase
MSDPADRLKAALSDRYVLERELGQGGMATVWLAHDLKHDRDVALKVFRPELASSVGPERFLAEIHLTARLQHPNILTLIDSGEADGLLYYVMPYVEGPTLRHRLLRERELPVGEVVRILRDVADALTEAHAHGVVHRDLKPENVMLSGRHALVADFGVAKAVSEATGRHHLTTKGVALGTPAYMAPEQAAADPLTDHRADIYALGVVAYEMLTGEPPFVRTTAQATLAAQVTEQPVAVTERRETVPPALAALVMRCLAKKPADRPQRAEEVLGVLEGLATPSGGVTPTETRPVAGVRGPASWGKVQRWVALASVAAAVVVLGILFWPRGSQDAPPVATGGEDLSLAVLYLDDLSRDTADRYLVDGLTEDVAASLGHVGRLSVKAPSAVRREQEAHPGNVSEIGQALGVRYVLEGSFRRTSTGIRVSARLVEHASETQIWGNTYDATADNLLDLPARVAKDVGSALTGGLEAGEAEAAGRRPTRSPAAWDAYLRGNFYLAQRTREAAEAAHREYERAVRLDPSFVAALARDAHMYVQQADYEWLPESASKNDLIDRALEMIDAVLAADSGSAEAWTARAYAFSEVVPPRWRGAREAAERAVALDPRSVEAQNRLGWVLLDMDDTHGAADFARETLALDPAFFVAYWLLGEVATVEGDLEEASAMLDSAVLLAPSVQGLRAWRARVRILTGDSAGARADAHEHDRLWGRATWLTAYVSARSGDAMQARQLLADSSATSALRPCLAALLWLSVREPERALSLLERRWREIQDSWFLTDTEFREISANPRFQRVLQQYRDLTMVR